MISDKVVGKLFLFINVVPIHNNLSFHTCGVKLEN